MIADGIDPIAVKRAEKEERRKQRHLKATPARTMTFRQAAEAYCESQEAEWSHAKHRHQVQRTLETYAYPEFGDLNVAEITTAHVLRVLSPIWSSKRETASRVRGRIEAVLDSAKGLGFRAGDNPAQWKLLKNNLAGRGRKVQRNHHASLPFVMMNAFLTELTEREGTAARALAFAILTASRTNEVLGAVAKEIDFNAKVWTIPPERMKAGKSHRVPLSAAALALLRALPSEEGNDFLFIGGSKGGRLANDAMMRVITKMEKDGSPVLKQIGHATPHGFRASFRQWGRELRIADFEVLEAALAHSIRSDTVNAYVQNSDLLDARRPLMETWARYCSTPVSGDNVVSLPSRVVR
jgi:integrase